jgi:hypothetical protein
MLHYYRLLTKSYPYYIIIPNKLPDNDSKSSSFDQEYKLKLATELIKEGLSVEQISRVLELPLELVKEQIEKSE